MARKLSVDIFRDVLRFGPRSWGLVVCTLDAQGNPEHLVDSGPSSDTITPATLIEPTMRLDENDVQDLMDQLWAQGVRPSRGSAEGELAATKRHLEDMRALAFKEGKKP